MCPFVHAEFTQGHYKYLCNSCWLLTVGNANLKIQIHFYLPCAFSYYYIIVLQKFFFSISQELVHIFKTNFIFALSP